MIIQSLVHYYEQLLEDPDSGIARPGWCTQRVKYLLELSPNGVLSAVVPCGDGKHGVAKEVPEQVKRSSGVAPNFLCDTSSYLLGIDGKGKPDRSRKCFEASKALHCGLLKDCRGPVARAILGFYSRWDLGRIDCESVPGLADEGILGASMSFCLFDGESWLEACEDGELQAVWESRSPEENVQSKMISLATGEKAPIARLHPAIKGVFGAQPSGASLVGFNAESFESYGHADEQGRNAPVDIPSTQAYATALNYLLGSRQHRGRLGDTTVVFWSSQRIFDQANCSVLALALGFEPAGDDATARMQSQQNLKAIMDGLVSGKPIDVDGVFLGDEFFLLGLAPNAARLAVRFFLHDSFGEMMRHVADHYRISDVCHGPSQRSFVTPYYLLRSLENPNSKNPVVSSQLSASLMRAVLRGSRYPEALYENVLLRVRATKKVEREHAAIIRAYLIRNAKRNESEVTVDVNNGNRDVAYMLGRAFYVLEQIQEAANSKATIADRYLNAACSTPATTFPVLLKLSVAHLSKLSREAPGLGVHLEKQLGELLVQQGSEFPKRLSLIDQGSFLLGYYQQKQARYQKKEKQEA